jgi:hypothetical protein
MLQFDEAHLHMYYSIGICTMASPRAGQKNRNPNPEYPEPEFCSGISGSKTRNTRTFMCHVLMSCLIINLYIYNYV